MLPARVQVSVTRLGVWHFPASWPLQRDAAGSAVAGPRAAAGPLGAACGVKVESHAGAMMLWQLDRQARIGSHCLAGYQRWAGPPVSHPAGPAAWGLSRTPVPAFSASVHGLQPMRTEDGLPRGSPCAREAALYSQHMGARIGATSRPSQPENIFSFERTCARARARGGELIHADEKN